MALLKIARKGIPFCAALPGALDDPTSTWLSRLVEDMVETMEISGGTEHQPRLRCISPYRIVVFQVTGIVSRLAVDFAHDLKVLITLWSIHRCGSGAFDGRSCLSVPGLSLVVPRHLPCPLSRNRPSTCRGHRARTSRVPRPSYVLHELTTYSTAFFDFIRSA